LRVKTISTLRDRDAAWNDENDLARHRESQLSFGRAAASTCVCATAPPCPLSAEATRWGVLSSGITTTGDARKYSAPSSTPKFCRDGLGVSVEYARSQKGRR
jgi:hypothetical protein